MDLDVARELFASAAILGIKVRIGIEFKALFRGRFVKIDWGPSGLQDDSDIEGIFRQEAVQKLMEQGREVQSRRTRYVHAAIDAFNEVHRTSIQQEFSVLLPKVDHADMEHSIGTGQPSIQHLGNYIHQMAMPLFRDRVNALRESVR